MPSIETSATLAACLLVLAVAIALDRRPYHPGKFNYIRVMIIAVAASLVLSSWRGCDRPVLGAALVRCRAGLIFGPAQYPALLRTDRPSVVQMPDLDAPKTDEPWRGEALS
jgi:hypothetical protein